MCCKGATSCRSNRLLYLSMEPWVVGAGPGRVGSGRVSVAASHERRVNPLPPPGRSLGKTQTAPASLPFNLSAIRPMATGSSVRYSSNTPAYRSHQKDPTATAPFHRLAHRSPSAHTNTNNVFISIEPVTVSLERSAERQSTQPSRRAPPQTNK